MLRNKAGLISLGVDKLIGIPSGGFYLGGFSDFQNLLAQW